MIKVSWQLVYSQKKWFSLLLFICMMTIITITLFQIIAATTEKYTIEKAQFRYGDFTGLLVNTDEEVSVLRNSLLTVGEYGIEDAVKIDHNIVQIGFFDETAFQMANFQLLKGHLPNKSHEVVIEEAYLQKIYGDSWGIGTRKKIGNQNLLLVGIIKNYSANWSMNIDVKNTYYGFPNIIKLKSSENIQKKHSYMIKDFKSLEKIDNELANKYGLNYIVNDQFYYKGLKSYKVMNLVKYFFLTALLIISSVSLCQIILIYYKKQEVLYELLKIEGMTKRKIEIIKIIQISLIISISSILSIPIIYIIYQFLSYYLYEYNLLIPWSELVVGLVLSTVFFFIILICTISLLSHQKRRKIKSQTIMYGLNSIVLIASIILLFTSIFIYKEEIMPPPNTNTLSISANRVTQTINIEGYDVALPPRKYIPEGEVEKIEKYKGVSSVQVSALTDDLKLYVSYVSSDDLEDASELEEFSLKPVYLQSDITDNLQIKKPLSENHAILIVSSKQDFKKNRSKIGTNLIVVRSDSQGNLKSWTYKIDNIKIIESENANVKVLINAKKAIQTKLFSGYNDVEVSLNSDISHKNRNNLIKKLSTLSALYNNEVIDENNINNPLSKLFKVYYIITFVVSIIFVCITIYFMLDRSLEKNSRKWGIYLSQGMNKGKIWILLVRSIPLLWLQSTLISSVILLIIYINYDYILYPITIYTEIFIIISLLILIFFSIVSIIFYVKLYKLSIAQLLNRGVLRE